MLDAVAVGLGLFEECFVADGAGLELFDNELAGLGHLLADEDVRAAQIGPAVLVADPAVGGHHINKSFVLTASESVHSFFVTLVEIVIIGVVGRGDFEEPRSELGLGVVGFFFRACHRLGQDNIIIFHDRDHTPHQR